MDSLITAAARALAAGDPLGALKRVALRDDAPALALRGIAMAQLGEFGRAKELLRKATRAFSPKESVARARCVVAEAEIALASRDLGWPAKALDAARATLEAHGDRVNAAHARYLDVRRLVLIGRLDEAERALADFDRHLSRPRRGPSMNSLLPESRCAACAPKLHAPRLLGPSVRAASGNRCLDGGGARRISRSRHAAARLIRAEKSNRSCSKKSKHCSCRSPRSGRLSKRRA